MDGGNSPTKVGLRARANRTRWTARSEPSVCRAMCGDQFSQPKQSPAVCHGHRLGAAQDVQFSENGLDVAFDGDFRDCQSSADQLVGLAFRKQPQNILLAWSQFFSG